MTAPTEEDSLHISSAVVHVRPERTQSLAQLIGTMPTADVFYAERGKIIVTLETAATTAITEQLNRIAQLDGVLAATLVYHEVTSLEALGETLCS